MNPSIKSKRDAALNVGLHRRFVLPQTTIVLATSTWGRLTSAIPIAGFRNQAIIPFREFYLRGIHAAVDLTQGTSVGFKMTTIVGLTDNSIMVAPAPLLNTPGLRNQQYFCATNANKSWYARGNATGLTFTDAIRLKHTVGNTPFYTVDKGDTRYPSAQRGVTPRVFVASSATGSIRWAVVVDQLSDDL